jgi:signal transduction histidine kinase
MLWKKAIPAKKRIREIEENLEREFIDTLDDPKEILEMIPKFISKASDEILILFSNTKTIETFERVINISQLLTHKAKNSVCIRILFHNNQFTQNMAKTVYNRFEKLFNDYPTQIKIQNIIQDNKSDCHNKVTMFIVDKDRVITIGSHDLFQNSIRENRDKSDVDEQDVYEREDNFENIGLATYSNSKSTVLSYSAIFDSLWNQTELYQKLEKANKRLKENENLQKDFINIAAHELRNPIQPIIGFTEILKNKATDAEQRQLHDIVYKNAKKLKQLSENILDITKIESQTLQVHKETFNLNQLIKSTISDFTKGIRKGNQQQQHKDAINIELVCNEDILIYADKIRLNQVISNLLNNAIKFTNEDEEKEIGDMGIRNITISLDKDSSFVVTKIKDKGKGIDQEILPRLFTKFATKSASGGTGLGLFICKNIVEAHGGKIWAENNADGKGATFSFSLPFQN